MELISSSTKSLSVTLNLQGLDRIIQLVYWLCLVSQHVDECALTATTDSAHEQEYQTLYPILFNHIKPLARG